MKETSGFWQVAPPDGRELRSFGLLIAAVGSLVAVWLWLVGTTWWAAEVLGVEVVNGTIRHSGNETAAWWTAGVALIFLGAALVWRAPLRPLHHVWMLLVAVLGYVMTHFWLAIVFYTLFLAIGLIMRVLRQDPLALKGFGRREAGSSDRKGSFWERREQPLLPAEHPEHQF